MAGWVVAPTDDSVGEHYARHVVPSFFRWWRDEVLGRLQPQAGHRVLDVACGTGAVAVEAARRVGPDGHVVGLDASAAMLAVARREARRIRARVVWRLGDAEDLPFEDASFDLLSCPHGLMFFDNRVAAVREMVRVLRPGGRLVATVWSERSRNPHEAALADAFRDVGLVPPPFFDILFDLAHPRDLLDLVERADVPVVASVEAVTRHAAFASADAYWGGMVLGRPVAGDVAALAGTQVAALREAAFRRLRDHACDGGFVSPMEALVLILEKPKGTVA